jgi:hypothetical protein
MLTELQSRKRHPLTIQGRQIDLLEPDRQKMTMRGTLLRIFGKVHATDVTGFLMEGNIVEAGVAHAVSTR